MSIDKEKLLQAFPPGAMRVNGFDVGLVIRELLDAAPTPPQRIYDEAKERELFEAEFPVPEGLVFDHDRNQYYGAPQYWLQQAQWEAWQKCAQSRAKAGEVGHE